MIRLSAAHHLVDGGLDVLPALRAEGRVPIWLDVQDPDEATIARLGDLFGFHPLALEDALHPQQRTKVETYPDYYFVVYYAARYHPETLEMRLQALHLFITRDCLVTVHAGTIPEIEETIRRWHAPGSPLPLTVGALLHALLDDIVDNYFPVIDAVGEDIEELETAIFQQQTADPTSAVFALRKVLLTFRRMLAPSRDVLNILLRRELPILTMDEMPYYQDVYDHTVRLTETVDLYRDFLTGVIDSHLSAQSNRLNEVLKILTVTSIILMANALVAGIYGMNFERMPELNWTYGYPFALGLMLVITLALVLFFRRRRWL